MQLARVCTTVELSSERSAYKVTIYRAYVMARTHNFVQMPEKLRNTSSTLNNLMFDSNKKACV